jgi:hypothetical protein
MKMENVGERSVGPLIEMRATIPAEATWGGHEIVIEVMIDKDNRLVSYWVGYGAFAGP